MLKIWLRFLTCFAIMACASGSYADDVCESSDMGSYLKEKGHPPSASCQKEARKRALKINNAIDQTFPLAQPATATQGATAFASFFAKEGVFQSPGGILRGKTAIFEGIKAYGENPGETNQHVITRKAYWDSKTSTLTVERTWFATLTAPRDFCGTVLQAGTTYSQDDALIVRFACDRHSSRECVLPGKVVYYHEYFNPGQFESNFTSDYPHPCHFESKN